MTRWRSPRHQSAGSCRRALHWRQALLWAPPMWNALETWTSSFSSKTTLFPAAGMCSWCDGHQWMNDKYSMWLQSGGWKSFFGSRLIISEELLRLRIEEKIHLLKFYTVMNLFHLQLLVFGAMTAVEIMRSVFIFSTHQDNTSYTLQFVIVFDAISKKKSTFALFFSDINSVPVPTAATQTPKPVGASLQPKRLPLRWSHAAHTR